VIELAITGVLVGVGDLALQGPGWLWFISALLAFPGVVKVLRSVWAEPDPFDSIRQMTAEEHTLRLARPPLPYVSLDQEMHVLEEIIRNNPKSAS
jgi:hypothetical protein